MPYLGGKSQAGVWQRIVNLIPPHDTYIEPFFGSGAIFRLKRPAVRNIGLDLAAPKTALIDRHANLEFHQACGLAFLESFTFTGREFVYCDPPYLLETRLSAHRYAHEFTRADHERLLRIVRCLPCPVMVSGYPSRLYDEALRDWTRESFQVMTRGHTWATEVLWFNYPRPILHDTRRVGANCRERWRIEKRRRRWAERIRKLPIAERYALFSALVDAIGPAAAARAISGAAS